MKHDTRFKADNSRPEPLARAAFRGVMIGLIPSIGMWIGLIWLVRKMLGF